jgi:DUF1009 family protein
MAAKLGILAGSGELPRRIVEACRATGRPCFVLAFEDFCEPATVADVPHAWVRLGAGGEGMKRLHENGVEELVMAGGVRRPSLWALRPDARAFRFFVKIGLRAMRDFGDDALFRAIIAELEGEGLKVVGVGTILSSLLAPPGPLGRCIPDPSAEADIKAGLEAARAHGARDLGQAVIVNRGVILGAESVTGTDALIRDHGAPGAVLVKMAKPDQERRADLPAIGPDTIAAAVAVGLRGIAVEAGATLLLDRPAMIAAADAAGLFVIGVTP